MEAEAADEIPTGDGWQYEPKWDGFRCLAFRNGADVNLQSKATKPLGRYFPEVAAAVAELPARRFVVDGEIAVDIDGRLAFDALLQRIHPAESRIRKLAKETPASFIVFDLLVNDRGKLLTSMPLAERRALLEKFAREYFPKRGLIRLSPATTELRTAKAWFDKVGGDLDGIIAKKLDEPYASGTRGAMLKIKHLRTADCVVGGFRYAIGAPVVGSLLLGQYGPDGKLHHVGFTSGIKTAERAALTRKLKARIKRPGFTGNAPGGPSRWSTERSAEWEPLKPDLVVEVQYDHFTNGRFRHGTRLLRWRPDKAPRQCRMDQVQHANRATLLL
jgi:ATP-dependent DNA ligase